MVVFRDSFLRFDFEHVQKFNLTTNSWSILTGSPSGFVYYIACIILPNEEVLLIGSYLINEEKTGFLFNPITLSFRKSSDSNFAHQVSISLTFYSSLFYSKVFCADFLYLYFGFFV